jgi:RNA polymerase II-associated factor 1
MAAAGDPKGFKQDMVVSIRYRNDLPPPPMPPKFLDIDNGGLAQYLTTSFASAMARREEPNIEVDAEGGMPIDMIGIPGYFLGDESGQSWSVYVADVAKRFPSNPGPRDPTSP